MSARYNYEDVREILVNCQDWVILSGGINDRKSCLALWDWCVPRIKGIIERISNKYGNEIIWNGKSYYTFPTLEKLKETKNRKENI